MFFSPIGIYRILGLCGLSRATALLPLLDSNNPYSTNDADSTLIYNHHITKDFTFHNALYINKTGSRGVILTQ